MINPGEGTGMHQLAQGLMNTSHDEDKRQVGRKCGKKEREARTEAERGEERSPAEALDWPLRSNRLTPLRAGHGGLLVRPLRVSP